MSAAAAGPHGETSRQSGGSPRLLCAADGDCQPIERPAPGADFPTGAARGLHAAARKVMVVGQYVETPSGGPTYLDQNMLVARDAKRQRNNGEPFLHVRGASLIVGALAHSGRTRSRAGPSCTGASGRAVGAGGLADGARPRR